MGLTLQTSPAMAGSVVEELRAAGVSYEDVKIALAHQEAQRRGGVPVLPLRVICGLDKPQAHADRVMLDNTRALLMVPRRGGRPQGGLHITRRKIWANSVKTESPEEAEFYRPLSVPQRTRLYRAKRGLFKLAQKLAHEARQKTRVLTDHELLVAQFTQSCERVLRHLLWQERGRKGWLTPDYETIMEWTSLSRSTVYRTLNLLKEIGLIEWIRRFNYSSDSQSGARSEQTSNLYRLTLPVWLEKMLGMYTPLPADEEHRRQLALEDHAAMLAAVSPRERGRLLPDDAGIRADLANAALRLDQRARALPVARECHKNIAPLMNYIFSKNGEKESAWSADAYGPDGLGSA